MKFLQVDAGSLPSAAGTPVSCVAGGPACANAHLAELFSEVDTPSHGSLFAGVDGTFLLCCGLLLGLLGVAATVYGIIQALRYYDERRRLWYTPFWFLGICSLPFSGLLVFSGYWSP